MVIKTIQIPDFAYQLVGSEFIEFLHAAAGQRGFHLTSIEPEPLTNR